MWDYLLHVAGYVAAALAGGGLTALLTSRSQNKLTDVTADEKREKLAMEWIEKLEMKVNALEDQVDSLKKTLEEERLASRLRITELETELHEKKLAIAQLTSAVATQAQVMATNS